MEKGGVTDVESLPLLLKVKEVALVLRVDPRDAYTLIEQNVIPSIRLTPKRIRVPRDGLINWIRQNTG